MNVEGKQNFDLSKESLWLLLMDPVVLAKITPGISELEHTGEDKYIAKSIIKIGPVKGEFQGKLAVEEKNEPHSFKIKMEQLSKIGNAHATINMHLEDGQSGGVLLKFNGKANLSGVLARTGQRVLSGVANSVSKQVFENLQKHIDEQRKLA